MEPARIFPVHPIVHVILHVQRRFFRDFSEEFTEQYSRRLERQANAFRARGIPVILIADIPENENILFSLNQDIGRESNLIPVKTFMVEGKRGDIVFAEWHQTPFAKPLLIDFLKNWKTERLILAGMYTGACIHRAIVDALDSGFSVNAVLEGMADHHFIPDKKILLETYRAEQQKLLGRITPSCPSQYRETTYPKVWRSLKRRGPNPARDTRIRIPANEGLT